MYMSTPTAQWRPQGQLWSPGSTDSNNSIGTESSTSYKTEQSGSKPPESTVSLFVGQCAEDVEEMVQTQLRQGFSDKVAGQLTERFNEMVLHDWSRDCGSTGRHVDFGESPLPPALRDGVVLGEGNSQVTKVEFKGTSLAKKSYSPGKLSPRREEVVVDMRKEVEILRRLRHHHVIELVGSFTHNKPKSPIQLEVLLWPVASCSLNDLFTAIDGIVRSITRYPGQIPLPEEVDTMVEQLGRIVQPLNSMEHLDITEVLNKSMRRVFGSFGCIADALAYCHGQGVSHKDIKPSNILIYPDEMRIPDLKWKPGSRHISDGIRLTDFDAAKDVHGAVDSDTGDTYSTRTYAAPEMRSGKHRSSRPADIFSLGCVYVEMVALMTSKSPKYYSREEIHEDYSPYFDNIAGISTWLDDNISEYGQDMVELTSLIKQMLSLKPEDRPISTQVSFQLSIIDRGGDSFPLYGKCCEFLCRYTPSSASGRQTPHTARGDSPALDFSAFPHINRNASGRRIDDATIEYNHALFKEFSALNNQWRFCQNFYLRGDCVAGRACTYEHGYELSQEQLGVFRANVRRWPCNNSVECENPACPFGHNCHWMRPGTAAKDRTKRRFCSKSNSPTSKKCPFGEEAHDMDLRVVSTTLYHGEDLAED